MLVLRSRGARERVTVIYWYSCSSGRETQRESRDLDQTVAAWSRDLGQAVAKVADFGVAMAMETSKSTASAGGAGTLAWMPPEAFKGKFSEMSDMFAFAVLMYELMSLMLPHAGKSAAEISKLAMETFTVSKALEKRGVTAAEQQQEWLEEHPLHTRRPDLNLVQRGCPPALLDWVEKSWSDNPDDRPTFREGVEFLGKVLEGRPYWGQDGSGRDTQLVSVPPSAREFMVIAARFLQTLPQATLVQIERVENGPLYNAFLLQVETLKKQMGGNWDEDRMRHKLFHGTEAVEAIVNSVDGHGFLPMLAGTSTGAKYGNGTYFARDAKYSDDYARTLPSGDKQMILVDVLVGLSAQGAEGMKVCPLLPGESYARYNSLVNTVQDPSIFVVQHSNQAYPSYLITYRH